MNTGPFIPPAPANDNDKASPIMPPAAEPRADQSAAHAARPPEAEAAPGAVTHGAPPAHPIQIHKSPGASNQHSRKRRPNHLCAVPNGPRDEIHLARIMDLQEQVHRLTKLTLDEAAYEDEPGPRSVLVNASVSLSGAYLKLMGAEWTVRMRIEGAE